MNYAKIVDGKIARIGSIRQLLPGVSFTELGPDLEYLKTLDILPVDELTSYDAEVYRVESIAPTIESDRVRVYRLFELTAEELAQRQQNKILGEWSVIRQIRDQRLSDSDWTQLNDVNLANQAAWAEYRQALRDITQQTDPFNIVWPTRP